jgi:hypothetical protein
VKVQEIAGSGVEPSFEVITQAEQAASDIPFQIPPQAEEFFAALQQRAVPAGQAGFIAPSFELLLGQTQMAAPSAAAETAKVAF